MSVCVREIESEDLLIFKSSEESRAKLEWVVEATKEIGETMSVIVDNEIVAFCGIARFSEDQGEVWIVTGTGTLDPKIGIKVARALRALFDAYTTTHNLRRIRAMAREDVDSTQRLLEILGFTHQWTEPDAAAPGIAMKGYATWAQQSRSSPPLHH